MMKKGETLPKLIKTDLLVNECRRCFINITLEKFIGTVEGTNKLNGRKLFIGFCPNNCPNVFYTPPTDFELEGDIRIIRVD